MRIGWSSVLIMAPLHFAISTRHDFRQVNTAPKNGELARLTTPGIDASRIERGLIDFSPRRTQRGVAVTKGRNIYRAKPYIRSVADYHIGDHVYVTPISRACWNEDHRSLIPLTRIKDRLSRPARERS